jgi:hypothetical protein
MVSQQNMLDYFLPIFEEKGKNYYWRPSKTKTVKKHASVSSK